MTTRWTRGMPKKPGLYWVWTPIEGGEVINFVGQVSKDPKCCSHCEETSMYVHGGGGSCPISTLAIGDDFYCTAIPLEAPKDEWVSVPKEKGLYLFEAVSGNAKRGDLHVARIKSVGYSHPEGDYYWRDGGSQSGNCWERGFYQKLEVPNPPRDR